jgi:hypothetical protein
MPSAGYKEGQKEADLRNELSTCLTSHWRYCMAGVLGGVPVGLIIKGSKTLKSIPFIVGGLAGTIADWKTAEIECLPLQEKLTQYLVAREKSVDHQ